MGAIHIRLTCSLQVVLPSPRWVHKWYDGAPSPFYWGADHDVYKCTFRRCTLCGITSIMAFESCAWSCAIIHCNHSWHMGNMYVWSWAITRGNHLWQQSNTYGHVLCFLDQTFSLEGRIAASCVLISSWCKQNDHIAQCRIVICAFAGVSLGSQDVSQQRSHGMDHAIKKIMMHVVICYSVEVFSR